MELELHVDRTEDLFSPPLFGGFGGSADVPSGVERLVTQMNATSHREAGVTIVIPDGEHHPDVEERVASAIHAYAAVRLRDAEQRRVAMRREGMRALALSVPLVVVLTALSVWVTTSGIAEEWRTAIDGLLIVLEWVALWYPLDTLFWYGRPLTQEVKVLRALETAPVTVRPSSALNFT
jgi:hypothetical protein